MFAKGNATWLSLRQPSSDSEAFDIPEFLSGVGSVLSNDGRRDQSVSLELRLNLPGNTDQLMHNENQLKEQSRRKQCRERETCVDQGAIPYHTNYLHEELRYNLPDWNLSDAQLVGNQIDVTRHENGPILHHEEVLDGLPQLPESKLHNFFGIPSSNLATTENMFVGGCPLLYPVRQEAKVPYEVSNDFHNPLEASGILDPRETFEGAQDKPVHRDYESPFDGLSLSLGIYESVQRDDWFLFDEASSIFDIFSPLDSGFHIDIDSTMELDGADVLFPMTSSIIVEHSEVFRRGDFWQGI